MIWSRDQLYINKRWRLNETRQSSSTAEHARDFHVGAGSPQAALRLLLVSAISAYNLNFLASSISTHKYPPAYSGVFNS